MASRQSNSVGQAGRTCQGRPCIRRRHRSSGDCRQVSLGAYVPPCRSWNTASPQNRGRPTRRLGDEPPTWHFYSTKPPLLPTIIAGVIYPFRKISRIPLESFSETERFPRYVQKSDPNDPSKFVAEEVETPKEKIKWPANHDHEGLRPSPWNR